MASPCTLHRFNNLPQLAQDSELSDDDIAILYDDAEAIVGLTILT
ncbi:MAG: hypothetical protein ACFCVB_04000 [Nodosilinea sp.]